MSRTRKGSKGSGYEYWSSRPGSHGGVGKSFKVVTHRIERRQGAQEVRRRVNEEL